VKTQLTLLLLLATFFCYSQTSQQIIELNGYIKNNKCREAENLLLTFDYVNSSDKSLPMALKNLAKCFSDKDIEKSIKFVNMALTLNQKQEDNRPNELEARILQNLSLYFKEKGNLKKAEEYILQSIAISKKIKDFDKNTLVIFYQTLSNCVLNNGNHKLNIAIQKQITSLLKDLNRTEEVDYWEAQIKLALELIELEDQKEALEILERLYPFENPEMNGEVFDYLTSTLLFLYTQDSISLNKKSYHLLKNIVYDKITDSEVRFNIADYICNILEKITIEDEYLKYITKEDLNACILKNLQFLFYTSPNKPNFRNNLLIEQSIQYFENQQSDSLSQFDKKLISTILNISDTTKYRQTTTYVLNVAAKYCEKLEAFDLAEKCYMKEFNLITKYEIDNDISKIFMELLSLYESRGSIDKVFPLFDSFLKSYKFNNFSENEINRFINIGYLYKGDYINFRKTLKNIIKSDSLSYENNERVSYWNCLNNALNAIDLIHKGDTLEAVSQLITSFHLINKELITFGYIKGLPQFNDDIVFYKNLYKTLYKFILPHFKNLKDIDLKSVLETQIDKNKKLKPFSIYFEDFEKSLFEEKKTELFKREKKIKDEINNLKKEEVNLKISKIKARALYEKSGALYEELAEIHIELHLEEKAVLELKQAKLYLQGFDESVLRINNKLISVLSKNNDLRLSILLKENEQILLKHAEKYSDELSELYGALGRYYSVNENHIESIDYFKKEYDILVKSNNENVLFSNKSALSFGIGASYFFELKDSSNGVLYFNKFLQHQTEYYKNLLGKITENQFYNLHSDVGEIEEMEFFAKSVLLYEQNPDKDIIFEFDFMKKNFFLSSELLLKKSKLLPAKTHSNLELISKLKENDIAIEFGYTFKASKKKYYAFLLSNKTSKPIFVNLCTQQQIDSLWHDSRQSEINNTINQFYNNQKVYELIWKPLEKHLLGVSKIYFAPAGNLHKIAFQAFTNSHGEKLSEKHQLIQVTSTSQLIDERLYTINSNTSVVLFGGINYDADSTQLSQNKAFIQNDGLNYTFNTRGGKKEKFPKLQFTDIEVKSIATLFSSNSTQLYTGNAATEEQFKQLGNYSKPSPTILHLATHGFYYDEPTVNLNPSEDKAIDNYISQTNRFKENINPLLRSGLILAGANHTWQGKKPFKGLEDGILTAQEIANLNLSNTKLVVLSACESGLGDIKENNEGIYGLQRAFKMAGVEYLLVSLWSIDDYTTQKMMKIFYTNLKEGMNIEEAYKSMVKNIKDQYPDEPFKWASFVLLR
jgi:CHAT domain-containing protein